MANQSDSSEDVEPRFTVFNGTIADYKRITDIYTSVNPTTAHHRPAPAAVESRRQLQHLKLLEKSHVDERGVKRRPRAPTYKKRALLQHAIRKVPLKRHAHRNHLKRVVPKRRRPVNKRKR